VSGLRYSLFTTVNVSHVYEFAKMENIRAEDADGTYLGNPEF
jgi:hypothetical protein